MAVEHVPCKTCRANALTSTAFALAGFAVAIFGTGSHAIAGAVIFAACCYGDSRLAFHDEK